MMLDIDHFKKINDQHGHAAGDRVLAKFAEVLAQDVRAEDVAGRIGGEEFAVLLPGCDCDEALAVAARIKASLESSQVMLESERLLGPTVSIGVHVDRRERNIERLLSFADGALYRAKNAGRSRCEMSAGSEEETGRHATLGATLSGRWRVQDP